MTIEAERKMSEPITVTYSLEEILKKIESGLTTIQKDVTDLKVGQVRLEEKIDGIKTRLDKVETTQEGLVKDVGDLKGAKSLIIPVVVAVITAIATLLIRSIPIQ
jgi:hypothetical protein